MLFWRGLLRRRLVLGVSRDPAIRIQCADSSVGLLENLSSLLKQGLDGVDKLLLVTLLLRFALFVVNGLDIHVNNLVA